MNHEVIQVSLHENSVHELKNLRITDWVIFDP